MPDELEALAFAARKGVDGLAQFEVAEADFFEQTQALRRTLGGTGIRKGGEKLNCFLDGCIEEIRDRKGTHGTAGATGTWAGYSGWKGDLDLKDVRAIPPSIAIRAANEDIAEKLHFDFFEAGAAATFALALAGIKTEGAGVEAALSGDFGGGE